MRFTIFAAGIPAALLVLQYALRGPHGQAPLGSAAVALTFAWFVAGGFFTVVYWIVRIARRAWQK